MSNSFAHFGLTTSLTDALARGGVTEPFPIQTEAIPPALEGSDIQGKAPTGSGKTLAFGLPVLQLVGRAKGSRPRALILAPTRELAAQIETSLRPLAKAVGKTITVVYGGVGYGPQKMALRKGADVLVATPGRLEDLIDQRVLDLRAVDLVVVDEADMADMDSYRRPAHSPPDLMDRQTLLFSATLDGEIAVLSQDFQVDPVRVEVPGFEDSIRRRRPPLLAGRSRRSCRPCRRRRSGLRKDDRLHEDAPRRRPPGQAARERGLAAVTMHGGRSQSQREAPCGFSKGRAKRADRNGRRRRGSRRRRGDRRPLRRCRRRQGLQASFGRTASRPGYRRDDGPRGQARGLRIQRELGMETVIGRPSVEELTGHTSPQAG